MAVRFEIRNLSLEEFEQTQIAFFNHGLEFGNRPHQQQSFECVATDNGKFVGCAKCLFQKFGLSFGKYCYLTDLLVMETYRNHGYGKDLLNIVEKESKELGIEYVWLWSAAYEATFYIKFGYKTFAKFKNFYESGHPRIGLIKKII